MAPSTRTRTTVPPVEKIEGPEVPTDVKPDTAEVTAVDGEGTEEPVKGTWVLLNAENGVEASELTEDDATAKAAENEGWKAYDSSDPFATLPDAETVTYTRGPVRKDLEKETSGRVKADVIKSFNGFKVARNAAGEELVGKAGTPMWLTLPFPNSTMLLAYVKQAKAYAASKEWTFRATAVGAAKLEDATTLRFCAKPKEIRTTV